MHNIDAFAEKFADLYDEEEIREVLSAGSFEHYQDNPVGFCTNELDMVMTDDIEKMMESVRDYRVTIAKSGNAPGKSYSAAALSIWFKKAFPDSQVFVTGGYTYDQLKLKLWAKVSAFAKRHKHMFSEYDLNVMSIKHKENDEEFIESVSIPQSGDDAKKEAKFSGAHAPNIFFILDEGDAIPDEIYRAIDSCMSGGNAKLLIMFNPRKKVGSVYRRIKQKRGHIVKLGIFTHPNVVTGKDIIPGAVTRDQTVKRINEWTESVGDDEDVSGQTFIVPKFLVGKTCEDDGGVLFPKLKGGRRKVINPAFSYMVLGEYPSASDYQLFDAEWIDAARARWDRYVKEKCKDHEDMRPTMSLDVSDVGMDSNVALFRYPNGFIPDLVRWSGVDPDKTADRATKLYFDRHADQVNVDSIGIGAGVAPKMNRLSMLVCVECVIKVFENKVNSNICSECEEVMEKYYTNAKRVMVSEASKKENEHGKFGVLRDELYWKAREWLRTSPNAMLPPDERLIDQLLVVDYDPLGHGGKVKVMDKKTMIDKLGYSPDEMESFILNFYKQAVPRVRVL